MKRATIFSPCYKLSRTILSRFYKDYESVILLGHTLLKNLGPLEHLITSFKIPGHLETSLHHLKFPSPLILAAFEGDNEIVRLWTQFGLGGATLKTILRDPRPGNPRPRIKRIWTSEGEGLINAMGLPGKGLSHTLSHLNELLQFPASKPIGFSIGGQSMDEYEYNILQLIKTLKAHPQWAIRPYFIEINISCPNTPDGQDMQAHPELLTHLLRNLKLQYPDIIMGPKVSPDLSNDSLLILAEIVATFPLTFITLGNAKFQKCQEIGLPQNALSIGGGGLTGPSLFNRTLEMTTLIAPLKIPIIATGGVSSAKQVQELQTAGATLIGMATAVVQNPYCIPEILATLEEPKCTAHHSPE